MNLKSPGRGRALICGSVAYDTIMVFGDRFANHILPDKIHMLNVSFLVPQLRREFGGCAGNIAYNLKALGGEPVVMATIGGDDRTYPERLSSLGIASVLVASLATVSAIAVSLLGSGECSRRASIVR